MSLIHIPAALIRVDYIQAANGSVDLYRVGAAGTSEGLWYNELGRPTGTIETLTEAAAAELPMGWHPVFGQDGRRWLSATDTLEALNQWFSPADMAELGAKGYAVERYTVARYRILHFFGYSHAVFCKEDVLDQGIEK